MQVIVGLWLGVMILTLIGEVITVAMFAIFLAAGAAAAAIGAALGGPWWVQVTVFAMVALGGVVVVRPLLVARLKLRTRPEVMSGLAAMIGSVGPVVETVGGPAQIGHVRIAGENWLAVTSNGNQIEAGQVVRVTAVDKTRLVVESESRPDGDPASA